MTGMFNSKLKAMLTTVVITIAMISVAFFITCNLSPLLISYPVHQLGISRSAVFQDYLHLLSYLEVPWLGQLHLENIPLPDGGRQHFMDVKSYFVVNEGIMIVSTTISCLLLKKIKQRKQLWQLLTPLKLILFVTLIASVMLTINFPALFVNSHYLLFRNLDWIMSAKRDEVILLMPFSFFAKLFIIWLGLFFFFLGLLWLWIRVWLLKFRFKVTNDCRNQGHKDDSKDDN